MNARRRPNSGVALILVLMSLALLSVLSVEILVASRVDLRIGRNARERLQAYYLAQSAARFCVLRLYLYREVQNLVSGLGGAGSVPSLNPQIVDGIWAFPLPPLPFPGMEKVDWPGKIMASIQTEGSKIPVNLLDGNKNRNSSEEIAKSIRAQIENLIKGLLQQEDFDKQYRGLKPEDLIDPLVTWVTPTQDGGRSDKTQFYERQDPPYKIRGDRMPTLTEIHMIENWNDDLYRKIARNFSVLNTRAEVNPNYISLERLRTFGPKLTDEDLAYIQQKRMEGPFQDLPSFEGFIKNDPQIKGGRDFAFGEGIKSNMRETIFVIDATGIVGEVHRTLRVGVRIAEEKKPPPKPGTTTPPPGQEPDAPPGTPPAQGAQKPGKLLEPQIVLVEETQI